MWNGWKSVGPGNKASRQRRRSSGGETSAKGAAVGMCVQIIIERSDVQASEPQEIGTKTINIHTSMPWS